MAERDEVFSRLQSGGFLAYFGDCDLNPLGRSFKLLPGDEEYDSDVYLDNGAWQTARPLLAKPWYLELTTKHFAGVLALLAQRGASGEEVVGVLSFVPRNRVGVRIRFPRAALTGLRSWERNDRGEEELKLTFRLMPDQEGQVYETT